VSSGALAEYVKPDDVCLMLRDTAGASIEADVTVKCVADGSLQLAFAVAVDCVSKLSVRVTVCGVALGLAVSIRSGYDAIYGTKCIASFSVGADFKAGLAVNADGSMMAVSYASPLHEVYAFQLTPSFERVFVIGRFGFGPAKFQYPQQLCVMDDDTILVCDQGNNCVQQLKFAGEYLSSFSVQQPISIAVHGDMVAVGTYDGPIEIHSLATGEVIRRFGSRGDGPGQIGGFATGIRFTPGGLSLLAAEYINRRLSLFTVDGVFIKHIGARVLSDGLKDVSFGTGGEIIVADSTNHRICVFSPDGDTLIKTWGSYRTAVRQFDFPKALAVSGSYLYVMDKTRVQVFQ
jgi:DNA-binding beta-propeller fold protein YncE